VACALRDRGARPGGLRLATVHVRSRSHSNPAAKAVSPANVPNLVRKWQFFPDPSTQLGQRAARFDATPVTYNGVIYVGAESGDFYAVQAATGTVVWKQFLGFVGAPCGAGVASTAALSPDPATGEVRVYVGGGDGFVYALNAGDGAVRWKTRGQGNCPTRTPPTCGHRLP
jgi:outer membrane protein assembly factor BamB